MRNEFTSAMVARCGEPEFCFLTGDLGFMALEPLQVALGNRFINMGIAEQNMVSVAAGLARNGLRPWVYSIAPFCYARPFEQVRNDICFHNLPVRLVGNGAGFGYGVQGPSHHAIEDCGVMSSLQNMQAFAPVFSSDVAEIVDLLSQASYPAYVRLGRDEGPAETKRPAYAPIRKLCDGTNGVVLAFGAIAGSVWKVALGIEESKRPSVWCASQLPLFPSHLPSELKIGLCEASYVFVIEEHVASGGWGAALARHVLEENIRVKKFIHRYVKGYLSGLYGSQSYHRKESGLDDLAIEALIREQTA